MLFSLFPAAAFADEPAAAEQADEPAAETADGSGALPDGALVEEPLSEESAPEAPPAEAAPVEEPVLEAIPASNNGNPVYYLKGGMNGWEQSDDWVLSGPNADGVYSKTFSLDAATELKVYASDDTWYGEGGSTSGGNVSVGLTGSLTVYFKPGEFLNVSDSSLGNGYYLVGNMNGWTENAAYQLSAFDSSIQYLDLNLNADSELKVTFFNYGARQWISPGDGQASYVPGKSGAMRVYFRPNGQGDENLWFSTVLRAVPIAAVTDGCFFVGSMNAWTPAEANRLIAYGSSFFLHVTGIPADSTFKVVRYSDSGMNEAWYPGGDNLALSEGGEYGITYSPNSGNNITIQSSPYNLPVEKVGNGTVTLSPSSVYSGDTVTVNAVPDEGYGLSSIKTQFRTGGSWITNKTLEGNSFFFTNSSTFGRVLVTFEPITYTVATVQPANGTVSVDVDAPVAAGTVVTVTATPSENYTLDAITVTDANGDPVAISNGQFTMPASNVTVTASFKQNVVYYNINSSINYGTLTFTSNGQPLAMEDDGYGSTWYLAAAGQIIDVVAAPPANFELHALSVSGNSDVETDQDPDNPLHYSFTMPAEDVNANAECYYAVFAAPSEHGSITITDENGAPATGGIDYKALTITAVPDQGYRFVNFSLERFTFFNGQNAAWEDWGTDDTNPREECPNYPMRYTAHFEPITYTVATVQPANGTVSVDVDAPVAAGTVVTVTATPSENYALDAITVTDANGDPVAVSNGQFTMPASNVTVTASFVYVPVLDDGFYLIGPDWSTASLKGSFTVNPDNSSEYQLAATLAAGEKLKVVKVERDAITAWYPDGAGNEYTVDAAHAGDVTIYFKSSYDEAWSAFGGFIWIAPVVVNYTVTCTEAEHGLVSASTASAPAGTSITLTVTPEDGYVLDTLSVTKQSGGAVEVSNNAFLMPEDNVTVTASFVAVSPITVYLDDEPGGTIEADKTSVLPGEVLTLTLTPDSGKYLEKLEYQWINHYQRYPIEVSGSTVQFTIPAPKDNADTIMFLPTWKTDYSGISLSITLTASYAGAASYTYATPTTPIYDTTVREAFYKWGSDFMFYLPYPNPFDAAAPAGYEFSRWVDQDGNTCMYFSNPVNSTGSITMTSPTLTVTAVYEKASYTKDFQSSITITPDTVWTDCPFHFSELVFAGQANSMYVKMETGTTTTNSSFGKLTKSDGSNDTLQFKLGMKDLPHNQSDECYAVSWQTQNTYFYSTDDTRYLGVNIPAEEWAKATPGTYTGNIHWSLDFGNLIHEDGVIPISLTIPEPSYEISTSATHGTVESDKESAQAGDTVTLTVTPDEGYRLFKLTAVDADSRKVEVTNNQFIMPASSVTVTATFVEQTPYYLVFSSSPDSADPQYQFTVTPTSDPFYSLGGVYVLEDISLPEGAQVRVGRYNGSSFECYYPADGYYTVCSGHWDDNNQIDVYFNTEMQQDTRYTVGNESYDMRWSHFGGYFWWEAFGAVNWFPGALYSVTVDAGVTNGVVNFTTQSGETTMAHAGETVTVTVNPAADYELLSVSYNDGEEHVIEPVGDVYSFVMPEAPVVLSAAFRCTAEPGETAVYLYQFCSDTGFTSAGFSTNNGPITVTADEIEGYRFLGWYEVTAWNEQSGDAESYGQLLTEESSLTLEMSFTAYRVVRVYEKNPLDPTDAFIVESYTKLLGREPSEEELAQHREELSSGSSTAAGFLSALCKESKKSNRELVEALVDLMLDGDADVNEWTATLDKGVSTDYIIKPFSDTAAFKNLCENSYHVSPGTVTLRESRDKNIDVTAFVQRCYKIILERDGEPGGLNAWTEALLNKTVTGVTLVDGFIFSPEFMGRGLSTDEQVEILYNVMLDRESEPAGKAGWVSHIDDNGASLHFIVNGFGVSPEFRGICESYGILPGTLTLTQARDRNIHVTSFVNRCYKLILGRRGDEEGLNGWTGALLNRTVTGATLVDSFISSPEFEERGLGSEQQVDILYRVMLDREPDQAGLANWAGYVEDDQTSIHFVVNGFSGSDEFGELCRGYGILPGQITLSEARDKNIGVTRFVNRCYAQALGRRADVDGLNGWCAALLSRTITPQQCAHGFVFSQECLDMNLDDAAFVTMLYRLYMGREPDEAGLNGWVENLKNGMSREQVVDGFAGSAEFGGIVSGYGL